MPLPLSRLLRARSLFGQMARKENPAISQAFHRDREYFPVADVADLLAFEVPPDIRQRKNVRQGLTRMLPVAQCIDHRNCCKCGQLLKVYIRKTRATMPSTHSERFRARSGMVSRSPSWLSMEPNWIGHAPSCRIATSKVTRVRERGILRYEGDIPACQGLAGHVALRRCGRKKIDEFFDRQL